jgi:hypothetical protein
MVEIKAGIPDTFDLKGLHERQASRAQVDMAETSKQMVELQKEMKNLAVWQKWFSAALVIATFLNVVVLAKQAGLF